MNQEDKRKALTELARDRQQAPWIKDKVFRNLSDYCDGRFECDYVSPYSRCAGNLESNILIFLQDWTGDKKKTEKELRAMEQYGRIPWLRTNKNLDRLLCEYFALDIDQVYATNLFPFIKSGGMSEHIYRDYLYRAALEFAVPHIDILKPKLVIVLGQAGSHAVARVCGRHDFSKWHAPDATPFDRNGSSIWSQYHPAQRKGWSVMADSWCRMADYYRK